MGDLILPTRTAVHCSPDGSNIQSTGDNANIHQGDVVHNHYPPPEDPRQSLREALSYEGSRARVEQLSSQVIPPDSFDWIWTTSFKDWLRKKGGMYWISGKPGSGKSTLMHFLTTHPKQLRKYMGKQAATFEFLSFFFDFRAGETTPNNETGMLRSFLSQLCYSLDSIEGMLAIRHAHHSLTDATVGLLLDVFCETVNAFRKHICIFVDGLDEFVGDAASLCRHLHEMCQRTSCKLVVACRPEPIFKEEMNHAPTVQMSDFNLPSVELCVRSVIKQASRSNPIVYKLLEATFQREVSQRAEGVIIWARLATESVVDTIKATSTREEIRKHLDNLPKQLGEMYEHRIQRLVTIHGRNAALLLCLLYILRPDIELPILHGFWTFWTTQGMTDHVDQDLSTCEVFEQYTLAVLGSFVSTINLHKRMSARGDLKDVPQLLDTTSFSFSRLKHRYAKAHNKVSALPVTHLRIFHKSLKTHLSSSQVMREHVLAQMKQNFEDQRVSRARLYTDIILKFAPPDDVALHGFIDSFPRIGFPSLATSSRWANVYEYYLGLKRTVSASIAFALSESLVSLPYVLLALDREQLITDNSPTFDWFRALDSPFQITGTTLHMQENPQRADFGKSQHEMCNRRRRWNAEIFATFLRLPAYFEIAPLDGHWEELQMAFLDVCNNVRGRNAESLPDEVFWEQCQILIAILRRDPGLCANLLLDLYIVVRKTLVENVSQTPGSRICLALELVQSALKTIVGRLQYADVQATTGDQRPAQETSAVTKTWEAFEAWTFDPYWTYDRFELDSEAQRLFRLIQQLAIKIIYWHGRQEISGVSYLIHKMRTIADSRSSSTLPDDLARSQFVARFLILVNVARTSPWSSDKSSRSVFREGVRKDLWWHDSERYLHRSLQVFEDSGEWPNMSEDIRRWRIWGLPVWNGAHDGYEVVVEEEQCVQAVSQGSASSR